MEVYGCGRLPLVVVGDEEGQLCDELVELFVDDGAADEGQGRDGAIAAEVDFLECGCAVRVAAAGVSFECRRYERGRQQGALGADEADLPLSQLSVVPLERAVHQPAQQTQIPQSCF